MGRCVFLASILLAVILPAATPTRAQTPLAVEIRGLGSPEIEVVEKTIVALGERGDVQALRALEALYDDRLKAASDGRIFVVDPKTKQLTDPMTGAPVAPAPSGLRDGEMNNTIRRVILPVMARLKLSAPDPKLRLAAAEELTRSGDESAVAMMRKAQAGERDPGVKEALSLALARIDVHATSADARLAAVQLLATLGKGANKNELEGLLRKKPDGSYQETDERVRKAATAALSSIENREMLVSSVGHLLYGLSLASVFLFAALGLAITFGVMGVINMAHGEMLTIGAYTTYAVQTLSRSPSPAWTPFYLLLSIPAAFVTAGATGVLLERTVIRWLYGRPLETLLATWGISLGLIQTIRLMFGASNVAVANPSWLAGGYEVSSGLVLSYNRIGVVLFVVLAAAFVWFILQRTHLRLADAGGDPEPPDGRLHGGAHLPGGHVDVRPGLGHRRAGRGGAVPDRQRRPGAGPVLHPRLLHGGGAGGRGPHRRHHRRRPGPGRGAEADRADVRRRAGQDRRAGVHHPVHPAPAAGHVRAQGADRGMNLRHPARSPR